MKAGNKLLDALKFQHFLQTTVTEIYTHPVHKGNLIPR